MAAHRGGAGGRWACGRATWWRSPEDRRRHLVEVTDVGAEQLAKAECALSAVEDEVLGALDDSQRETLYSLLQQAATGTVVKCAGAIEY